jgi:transposase
MKRWPKLSAVVDCASHFIVSAKATKGPRRDTCEAPSITRSAHRRTRFGRGLFDAGYDSEKFHVLLREDLGAQSIIPPKSGRKTRKWPKTRWRREMRRSFPKEVYGQRWQVESVFSRHKRRLGSALAATSWAGQKHEIYTRVLTHDLMLLKRRARGFLQSNWDSYEHRKAISFSRLGLAGP